MSVLDGHPRLEDLRLDFEAITHELVGRPAQFAGEAITHQLIETGEFHDVDRPFVEDRISDTIDRRRSALRWLFEQLGENSQPMWRELRSVDVNAYEDHPAMEFVVLSIINRLADTLVAGLADDPLREALEAEMQQKLPKLAPRLNEDDYLLLHVIKQLDRQWGLEGWQEGY